MTEHMTSKHATTTVPQSSVRRWLLTTNHKDVGILYLVTSLFFLVAGGALAMLVRAQLAYPNNTLLTAGPFNQAVTMHGLVTVLWFLSPLAFAFANYFVPLQIGTRDLAFPRLNALSYWLFLFSGLLAVTGFFTPGGAISTGWTVYAPLSEARFSPQLGVVLGAAGLLVLVASVTMSTVNFMVTILHSRAQGLKFFRMPMFTWSIFFTVVLMLLAFPALAGGLVMLAADRLLGTVFFSSTEGGAILWTHVFWFFGHPEVYIVLLPALGVVAEILPTFARRPLYGKKIIIGALMAATALSMIVWVHHMFLTGINPSVRKFMTITTEVISIPFGVIMLSFILTLVGGSIKFKTPMLFALGSIILFIIGGITGVFNSSVALDYGLRGTYWIVGHFHYTMVGGAVTGMIAAIYYWWPKITGRMYNEKLGKIHFAIYIASFNLLYFPMHYLFDMPRRVFVYNASLQPINFISTIGAFIFGPSMLILFANLLLSLKRGEQVGKDPWVTSGLEWMTSSPPPMHNFDKAPSFARDGSIEFVDEQRTSNGTGLHANADTGSEEHLHAAHLSRWPVLIGLGIFVAFIGVGLGLPIFLGGVTVLAAALVGWARDDIRSRSLTLEPPGEQWPFEKVRRVKLGMWVFLASEMVLFGSLIGSYLFVRIHSVSWPLPGEILNIQSGSINTFILITSGITGALALASIRNGSQSGLRASLLATLALGSLFLFNKGSEWSEMLSQGLTFSSGLPASTFYTLTGLHGAHVTAGLIVLVYLLVKAFNGRLTKDNHSGVEYFGLYWAFVDIVWLFLFPLLYLT